MIRMAKSIFENEFLSTILALQQDGKQAISAPANWIKEEPLLEVPTDIDSIINELETAIIGCDEPGKPARWHFFIGSPGNGKSAATGKLCRNLVKNKECRILDEQGCPIEELDPSSVPYGLDVYEAGQKFVSARIVQDASVVRKPFDKNVDPASELVSTLREVWQKGVSLIICTNRGVLEKAHRDNHLNPKINGQPWFRILTKIVQSVPSVRGELPEEWDFDGKRSVFKKVKVTFSHLDNRSLLIGSDIFNRLVLRAVDPKNWKTCSECPVVSLCPFKANRDWLDAQDGREKFLNILRRAEAFSGQIIVFREALSLLSFILAGCPRDYGNDHPCSWVKRKAESGDVFSLATRRIYMAVFASFSPLGLEPVDSLQEKQVDAIKRLKIEIQNADPELKNILELITGRNFPSTDVGTSRLLGRDGILSRIDPCIGSLPSSFYDAWDGDYRLIQNSDSPFVTSIERKCSELWTRMEQAMESIRDYGVLEAYWALRRWSSNFLLHLGALIEGRTAWAKELDEFLLMLEIVSKPSEMQSIEEKRRIHELNDSLEALLDTGASGRQNSGSVQLTDTVEIVGSWVRNNLKPKIDTSERSASLTLSILYQGGERATLGAQMFIWLNKRARGKLDHRCLPPEILAGAVDARIRAAAKGKYAFQDDDVELIIATGGDRKFQLVRIEGDVLVRESRQ